MNRLVQLLAGMAMIAVLAGCAPLTQIKRDETDNKGLYDQTRAQIKVEREIPAPVIDPYVTYHQDPIVILDPIRTPRAAKDTQLTCRFRKLATAEPVTIQEFAQIVTRWCGVPVRVTQDALDAINQAAQTTTSGSTGGAQPQAQAQMMPMSSTVQPAGQYSATAAARLVDITYSGDLPGLLNVVAARFGLSWKSEDGSVTIFYHDTRTFYLYAIASSNDITADNTSGTSLSSGTSTTGTSTDSSTSSTGGGVSGTTGSLQTAKISIKTSIWDDIKKTVDVISTKVGNCSLAPAAGSITCNDTEDALEKIGHYIQVQNENLTKQVIFHVRVVSVTFKDNNSLGLSWNLVFQDLQKKYGVSLASSFAGASGSTAATFSVLNSTKWNGTDVILQALAEYGTVSIIKQPTVATLNLNPAPVQVGNVDSYIPGSTTTTTANVGTTTSLQIGTVTTGFSMTLLPYVLPGAKDNMMLLHFSLAISNLDDIRKVQQGNAYAEAPIISLPINSVQKVRLRPGQTLMLTGFDQDSTLTNRQGTGTAHNWLFGGGASTNQSRSTLVVLITPVVD